MNPIKRLRRDKGLEQGQLARLTGASIHTVKGWERGAIPRARYLPALAAALGVTPAELDDLLAVGASDLAAP